MDRAEVASKQWARERPDLPTLPVETVGRLLDAAARAAIGADAEDKTLAFYCAVARQCFVNEFVFDGNLEGEISSVDGILTVGENADVRGEVKSKTVIVKGKVHGNITVQERCELHSRSQLIGDLKAARLVIEEGATFVGKSEVTPNKNAMKDFGAPGAPVPHKEELQKVGAPR